MRWGLLGRSVLCGLLGMAALVGRGSSVVSLSVAKSRKAKKTKQTKIFLERQTLYFTILIEGNVYLVF